MVKRIQISSDDITYYTLPGNSGELRNEAGELADTIFGQAFESTESGLITGTVNTNALYKGFAGYVVKLQKGGTPITMTAEAMSLVSGKTYVITNAAKQLIDIETTIVVFDNAIDRTVQVESIDFLRGRVTFKSTYTVVGPVTITGKYVPLADIAGARTFNLTQGKAQIDGTDIPTAKANDGFRVFQNNGLKTVNLEIGAIWKTTNAFFTALKARDLVYVSINPDNSDLSVAKGLFKFTSQAQSGDVGALSEETITLRLAVPQDLASGITWTTPFVWIHSGLTTLATAVQKSLASWEADTQLEDLWIKYLEDGTNGFKAKCVVADISLSGGLESMNEFTASYQLSGALTAVP